MPEEKNKNKNNIYGEFVICPLSIILKYDALTACLYGLINSKCNLSKGVCCASQTTLGKELGVSRQTISKRIKCLKDANLINVKYPNRYKNGGVVLYIKTNDVVLYVLSNQMEPIIKKIRSPFPEELIDDFTGIASYNEEVRSVV